MLNKLAQGQSLAVLEGTATPYSYKTMAEPGSIRGLKAKKLSAERTTELMQVMKAFTRDWGIAFDVEVTVAPFDPGARSLARAGFESRPLVARFTPRNFSVHNGRRLSSVMTNPLFLAIAKPLYQAVTADLKARCIEAFAIKDPVDVKIQLGLKDDIACVVRTDLEGVEALAQVFLADFRKKGFSLAVRFLENYLKADGDSIELSREAVLEFEEIQDAVQKNIDRFKEETFIAPGPKNPASSVVGEITKDPKATVRNFQDHWVVGFDFNMVQLGSRFLFGSDAERPSGSIAFGPGGSGLTSTGDFLLQREGTRILVAGAITHVWTDDGYNFDPGKPFHEEAQVLERHGKAKPFQWEAKWEEGILGELQIENAFSPNATRRWVSFETNPMS